MEPQTIIFKSNEDYISKRNKMYDNIKDIINECVITDKFEYEHMSYQGLTSRQDLYISVVLCDELKKFTEHKCDDWCDKISFNIMLGINGFLNGLIKIKRVTDFTAKEYAKLIHNSIMYQLDNGEHSPCLLEDIIILPDSSDTE